MTEYGAAHVVNMWFDLIWDDTDKVFVVCFIRSNRKLEASVRSHSDNAILNVYSSRYEGQYRYRIR